MVKCDIAGCINNTGIFTGKIIDRTKELTCILEIPRRCDEDKAMWYCLDEKHPGDIKP